MVFLTLALLLLLFVLIALPGLYAITHARGVYFAAPFYLILLVGLSLHYLGLSFGGRMPVVAAPVGDAPALCEQAIDQAERNGLILERNARSVTVARGLWQQIPEQIQEGIVLCLDMGRPASQRQAPIQVIETGAPGAGQVR